MRQLNLLPPRRRENLRREFLLAAGRRFTASVVGGLLLVSLGGLVAIGLMMVLSALDQRSGEDELAESVQQYRQIRAEIAASNRLIATIDELGKDRIVWSDLIAEVLSAVPAGATVESLQIDGRNALFTFSGVAPSRTSLVEFEERLRQLSWAGSIDAPRDNLLKAVNPDYRFSIQVDLDNERNTSGDESSPSS
jgi:Tfp pilus assembly protein PilN